jgi:putative SOS response-associated peptidase YedK
VRKAELVNPLLKPYPENEMEAYPIGLGVNNPKNEGEGLIQPL